MAGDDTGTETDDDATQDLATGLPRQDGGSQRGLVADAGRR